MTERSPVVAPDQLTLRQLLLSLKLSHLLYSLAFLLGLLGATFRMGKVYSDDTTKVSLEAELKARDRKIQQLASEKAALTQARQALVQENAELKKATDELTQTVARMGLCEPIRAQLTDVIRVHGQTKERLLLLETAHTDYRVDKKQIDTTRQQVADLGQDIKRFEGELANCQARLTSRSTGPAGSKPPAGR